MLTVDISRARITTPDGSVKANKARFVFFNGTFAIWTEDRQSRTATRILFGQGAEYVKTPTARTPDELHISEGNVFLVQQLHGGGCGCSSALKGKGALDLIGDESEFRR